MIEQYSEVQKVLEALTNSLHYSTVNSVQSMDQLLSVMTKEDKEKYKTQLDQLTSDISILPKEALVLYLSFLGSIMIKSRTEEKQ